MADVIPARDLDPDALREEAIELLSKITAEFRSDPLSVQCFDLRIVRRAVEVSTEYEFRRDRSIF